MSKPITIPNVFQNQVGPIPLSQLDADFTTVSASVNDYQTYSNGVTDTGTTNSLVVTIVSPATFAYALFVALDVLISNTTTSAAPTINVNSLGAKTITLADGSSLPTGTLAAGGIYRLIYDGTNFRVMGSLPGNAFFANPTASVGLTAVNGSATTAMRSDAAPALSQAISPTWSGTHTFSNAITVNGAGSSLKGGVTITAPASSGVALNVTGASASAALNVGGTDIAVGTLTSVGSTRQAAFQFIQGSTAAGYLGADGSQNIVVGSSNGDMVIRAASGASAGTLRFVTSAAGASTQVLVGSAGNVTIAAPSSGAALTVIGAAGLFGSSGIVVTGSNTSGQSNGVFIAAGTTSADAGLRVQNQAQNRNYLVVGGDGSIFAGPSAGFQITAVGGVAISAPTSGNALTVTAVANARSAQFNSTTTAGQSFGPNISAGTNSSDNTFSAGNAANTLTYLTVRGDGLVQAMDQGNTLQDVGWRGTPVNVQSANYTLSISDRGKTVRVTAAGVTITVPPSVFSASDVVTIMMDSGSSCTIAQGSGVTLHWAGNGSTTGNRTLTGEGLATLVFKGTIDATISGAGLT